MKIAVIKTGGKQYKVAEGQILKIEKIPGEKDQVIEFDNVLMIADEDGKEVEVGQPLLEGKKVSAQILLQGRSKKILIIKFKRKTRYRRKNGHRQFFTQVKIEKIA